jgi:hypothetical protein
VRLRDCRPYGYQYHVCEVEGCHEFTQHKAVISTEVSMDKYALCVPHGRSWNRGDVLKLKDGTILRIGESDEIRHHD